MSGNPALDAQIMRSVQPQYNPMQAIGQMQRPMVQPMQMPTQMPVQNPVFGGAIPMSFGLPQASQMPEGYTPRLASFQPSQKPIEPYKAPPSAADVLWAYATGTDIPGTSAVWSGGTDYSQGAGPQGA